MSNSIWKTPDHKPDIFRPHRILVIYEANDEPELMFSAEYAALTADRYVNRWCYWDEFIAQADKAERLQKAVDFAVRQFTELMNSFDEEDEVAIEIAAALFTIKQLIKETQ